MSTSSRYVWSRDISGIRGGLLKPRISYRVMIDEPEPLEDFKVSLPLAAGQTACCRVNRLQVRAYRLLQGNPPCLSRYESMLETHGWTIARAAADSRARARPSRVPMRHRQSIAPRTLLAMARPPATHGTAVVASQDSARFELSQTASGIYGTIL